MKHLIKYIGVLLAVVFIGSTFTACSDDKDNGSAEVGLGIKVFFPTKVVTNQPVTINGSGFNDVTEIEFPGGVKVTNFKTVSDEMIIVDAPSGIAADGGKIIVRTANGEAESRLPLTLGKTKVSGYSKQPGEEVSGGELITVFGADLEFITGVELLDAEGNPQLIDHADFYRKSTNNLMFYVPKKDIFDGTFAGVLYTYDGQEITMPELAYKPVSEGHWEIIRTSVWKNDGSMGEISWSSDYRFAPESNPTGEECYVVPQDLWDQMKSNVFYVKISGTSPQIRVTTGWWSATWTGEDIFPGNERLTDNGDGTMKLTVNFGNDAFVEALDAQHLLFTGGGYAVEEIYFEEEVWIEGPVGPLKTSAWQNDGSLGDINWSSDYRFANESTVTGEECYAFPLDIWDKLKSGTFYVTVKGATPQIRVTTGWWSTTWTGEDIIPGNERLVDNGDGTWTLTVNFDGDPIADVIDAQHLLFTGGGYSVVEIYFLE